MKRIKGLFVSISLLLMVGGCTSPFTPDFGAMSAKYATLLEQYQINMIFQNIVRAAHTRPLSFLDIPSINGSGSIAVNPSVSGLFNGGAVVTNAAGLNIAGGLSAVTPSLGATVGKSFNFSQSSLDNAVFWKGFLTELPPETVKYFVHNHLPRELIYSLVIDEIVIQSPDGTTQTYINNPMLDTHPEFQRELYSLIKDGLTPQYVVSSQKIGGIVSESKLQKAHGDNYRQTLLKDNLSLVTMSVTPEKTFQIVSTKPEFKLCLKTNRFSNFEKDVSRNDYCQVSPISEDEVNVTKEGGSRLYVKVRSTSNIYAYLGEVVNAQLQDKPYLVSVPPPSLEGDPSLVGSTKYAVLVVKKNSEFEGAFAYLDDVLEGNKFVIPMKNNGYSKLSVKTLAEFQTLQKIPGSLTPSPSVLIR